MVTRSRLCGNRDREGDVGDRAGVELLRLAGHVLIEQHDEWDGAGRRYFSEHSMKLLNTHDEEVAIPELNAA